MLDDLRDGGRGRLPRLYAAGEELQVREAAAEGEDGRVELGQVGAEGAGGEGGRGAAVEEGGGAGGVGGVEVGDYEALGDVRGAVAEGELAEDAVGESAAKGFGEGDVRCEEDYMGGVCGGDAGGPVGEVVSGGDGRDVWGGTIQLVCRRLHCFRSLCAGSCQ